MAIFTKDERIEELAALDHQEERLIRVNKMRTKVNEKKLDGILKVMGKDEMSLLQVYDLILLRRYSLDTQKGKNLEPRWVGPYTIERLARNKRSAVIRSVTGGKASRHHINNLTVGSLVAEA